MPTIYSEGFETDGNGTRYRTSVSEFTDGSGDFFARTDGSTIGSFYEVFGASGSFYFSAMDLDGEGGPAEVVLEIAGIDISGFTDLDFSILLAEDDDGTNEDYDDADYVLIEYQIDDGGFENLLAVAAETGTIFNGVPRIDTDFDGEGDGAEITATFAEFTSAIAGTGALLDVRITYTLDSGDEDLSIDDIVISGESMASAPTAALEGALGVIGTLGGLDGAEISVFDPGSNRLFVTSGSGLQIVDLSDPANPAALSTLTPTSFTDAATGSPFTDDGFTSVAVSNGLVAGAVPGDNEQQSGAVLFFEAATGAFLGSVTVGALPDMLTFTPDGTTVLVANEGEPDGSNDPEGSVSIVSGVDTILANGDVSGVSHAVAGFGAFNGQAAALRAAGVRLFPAVEDGTGEQITVAQDLEPEYIAVAPDGETAVVTLQEANALAIVDIDTATVVSIEAIDPIDHSVPGNEIDPSDEDQVIDLANWPVFGLSMPDAVASYEIGGETYYVTANEGDARNADDRVGDVALDPTAFPNAAELQDDDNLGRLDISIIDGDTDGDGDFDQLFAYGSRSFSIFDESGNRVFDSGSAIARIVANETPTLFNANDTDPSEFDNRSDNKGAEPEGVTVGEIDGRFYAFIGLERVGSVQMWDVTNPLAPVYVDSLEANNPLTPVTNIAPEGLTFIGANESPSGDDLLVVTYEDTNTMNIVNVSVPESAFTLELLHIADQEAAFGAIEDAPNLSAVLNALRAQDLGDDGLTDNTITLSSGDAIIPGLFFDASAAVFGSQGIAHIQIQNELGIEAMALGNHEFDLGTAFLAGLIDGTAAGDFSALVGSTLEGLDFDGTDFPYLSANLDFSTDANLAPLAVAGGQAPQERVVTSSTVIEENGELIGVVGATTPTLDRISSPGDVTISPAPFDGTPTDEQLDALAAEIQLEVDALLAANASMDKVILLAHMQQIQIELALAERLENVDIIVAGGSNTRLFDENDRARDGDSDQGEYPQFVTNAGGTATAVVNTDGSYKYVGRLVIDFDENGNIIPASYDAEVSGAYATDDQGVTDLDAEGLIDPEIQAIVDAIEAEIIANESNVFGVSDVFLNGNRSGIFTADDPDGVRTQETNLGNLTADANLAAAKEFDSTVVVSIKNGGGIRASIGQTVVPAGGTEPIRTPNEAVIDGNGNVVKPEGGISQNDIQTTLAFNNGLSLLTVTKAELVAALEHAVGTIDTANAGGVAGSFPQISGVKFSFDDTLPAGERIQNAGIFDENDVLIAELVRNGEIVGDTTESFRIVTLNFMAGGGDGFPFDALANPNRVDLYDIDGDGNDDESTTGDATFAFDGTEQDALAEYLNDNFNPDNGGTAFSFEDTGPNLDERIQNLAFRSDTVLMTPIYEIQGNTHLSAYDGETVTTSGIVTAVAFNGYYLQDPNGDGDDATSDGIFVFTGAAPSVAVGDEVEVSGTVAEFIPGGASTGNLSVTQISQSAATVVSSGNALPTAVLIGQNGRQQSDTTVISPSEEPTNLQTDPGVPNPDVDAIDFFESIEGMLVTVDDPVAISQTRQFSPFSSEGWVLADNGANASGRGGGLNDRGGITINAGADGTGDLNPERIQLQYDPTISGVSDAPELNVGDQLDDVTGVVGYNFGNYEINVTGAVTVAAPTTNTQEVSSIVASDDELTFATYNVLNLSPDASDDAQRAAIASQIVNNLNAPDIIALQEIQDDSGETDDGTVSADQTLQALVDAIVAAGGPRYEFADVDPLDNADGGVPGGNIRNAFLYNPGRVELNALVSLDEPELTARGVTMPTTFNGTRDPLLGVFQFGTEEVTVINNHFSSRFGSTPIFGGPQPFVQAGETARENEAKTINEVVDQILANEAAANVIVAGDLNTFEFTDELTEDLPGVGAEQVLQNLANGLAGDENYTFIFDGNSQALDHIFASNGLAAVAEVDVVHVNNDFTFANFLRPSDHDPVVASFFLPNHIVSGASNDTVNGTSRSDVIFAGWGNDSVRAGAGNDNINASQGDDEVRGQAGDDHVFGSVGDDTLFGNDGDDKLVGGVGDDELDGGNGNDILVGNDGDDIQRGQNGDDFLSGGAGDDQQFGGLNDDNLVGNAGDDIQDGGKGNDTIVGNDGNDVQLGQNGDDFLSGGAGNDEQFGHLGNDVLVGNDGNDRQDGGKGDDRLIGNDGNDTQLGQNGDDFLSGGAGNDNQSGHLGDDSLYGRAGNDYQHGGMGDDLLDGGNGNDRSYGHLGADIVIGGAGNDSLFGNNGNDQLFGGAGNDVIRGGFDDDIIEGGEGNDFLIDGVGNNTFVFNVGDDTDTVKNFVVGSDRLEFVGSVEADLTVSQNGQGTVIDYGQVGDLVVLRGVDSTTLDFGTDFIFS